MATMITEECIGCGACEDECPNEAISVLDDDELFIIDPDLCTECVGYDSEQACQAACPPEVCIPNPEVVETEAELFAKAKALRPDLADTMVLDESTSHISATA